VVLAHTTLGEEVQDALMGLSADFREAVVLCDVVGMSYDEIAVSIDVPVGTVRSRIHRGRRLLREALA
jgi:RNA polymerase sigma-70 factor (ECF subfamily)